MQVTKLSVSDHKCLVDFNIQFTSVNGGSSTILIGENGTGKSTFLVTLLTILMSFDSDRIEKEINYNYELTYIHAGSLITITQENKLYRININDQYVFEGSKGAVQKKLAEIRRDIFPSRIMYFYSGAHDQAHGLLRKIDSAYAHKCRMIFRSYYQAVTNGGTPEGDFPRRKYLHCDEELVNIYGIAVLAGSESVERHYLKDHSNLENLQNVDFSISLSSLKQVFGPCIKDDLEKSFHDFADFLDRRLSEVIRYIYIDEHRAYYTIEDLGQLNLDSVSLYNFFEKIRTLLDGRFQVYASFNGAPVALEELSEGQRQLIKILGMLGVCKREDCLVLMDEPDAHMNPLWKYELKSSIDESLRSAINTQAIIATHDPLVINGVEKEFIRIFAYNQDIYKNNGIYVTKVIEPQEDTAGMGIDGLLQSEYYGLSTVLDKETQEKVDYKRDLLIKKVEGTLTDAERSTLNKLTEEIEDMTFTRNIPTDDMYDEYVATMHKIYKERNRDHLTATEIEERNATVEAILRELTQE